MSRYALAASTALATLILTGAARADVTADDVWRNLSAYLDTMGGTLSAEPARTGNTLSLGDMSIEWVLPFDAGKVAVRQSGYDLVEQGDGTVRLELPERIDFSIRMEPTGKPPFSMAMAITHDGFGTIASGQPDDITYVTTAESMSIELTGLEIPEAETGDAEMTMTFTDVRSESRVTVGSLVSAVGTSSIGSQDTRFSFQGENGAKVGSTARAGAASAKFEMDIPRNGISILNLAAAVRDGLRLSVDSSMNGYETHQIITVGDETVSEQHNLVGVYDIALALDHQGLTLEGSGKDTAVRVLMPETFPLEMAFTADLTKGRMVIPHSAGEQLQQAAMSMELSGLTVGEQLWGLIDPAQTIPRDPATVRLDLTADVKSHLDWLDFLAVGASMKAGQEPGELHSIMLRDLTVEAAGASLAASGQASFDNADKQTFGGFPKPTGALDMTVRGANALIDRLIGIGLVSEEEAIGARMGMGMILKPATGEGEDVLKSHIELNGEGQVLANGIRIR